MAIQHNSERIKTFLKITFQKIQTLFNQVVHSATFQKIVDFLKWRNLRPRLLQIKEVIVDFTKQQPKTACFIYVCLFCAFSIVFLDEPCCLSALKTSHHSMLFLLTKINPAGWWFLILIALWLTCMAVAGLSLTTDVFEKNMVKARAVLFVLLALSLSSLATLFLNILTGRYTPEFLDTMHLYGFSAMRFRVSETSFPSFDVQSIWAVAMAAGVYFPRAKRWFCGVAGVITVALVWTAQCFISDAVMGMYIGIIMYYAAAWIVSENRENFPLISL
ncbi:MAG: phosphatase PAP2 family protein [Alphaproteobacteria bacterium]|nr:phosphatase PAP2 family protein [Alphaproteobacteria bacterium]